MTVTPAVASEAPEIGFLPDGRPDPEYATAVGLVAAPRLRRSLAFAVDAVIWGVIAATGLIGALPLLAELQAGDVTPTTLARSDNFGTALLFYVVTQSLLFVLGLVQLILHGIRGVTFGKMIFGLRTVRASTFAKPGFWRIVARAVVMYLSAVIVPFLGVIVFLLSPIWDPQRRGRGWHDRMFTVWMVDVRTGLDPTDAKALRLARKAASAGPAVEQIVLPSLATRAGHASDVEFVPSARSSSGVIAAHAPLDTPGPLEPWDPPAIGNGTAAGDVPSAPATASAPVPPDASAPPLPRQEPVQQPTSEAVGLAPSAFLRFDDGAVIHVHGTGLLGRNPEPRPGETVQYVIPVPDSTLQISKTHASFGFDDRGFWISDRNSSNGTTVIPPSGEPLELTAGQREYLVPGSSVLIGGRRFSVEVGSSAA
ncbi:hypothetical protein IWX78_001949 [Mycetocola sp. CAN_C7]|uniref:RDD family protein n=1 Tax=Mycetocola sp. CAN_C7 TaxID=2787724 RepID=UPI0018CA3761